MRPIHRKPAVLALADGTIFHGFSDSRDGLFCGEVIFTTSMGGYEEVCTDPSYAHQIVVFTCPHIGNTGINEEESQSSRCWLKGVIMKEPAKRVNHWRATTDLASFLKKHEVPSLFGVDTRCLTNHLREKGSQVGCIAVGSWSVDEARTKACEYHCPPYQVSTQRTYLWNEGRKLGKSYSVCVIDFGVKKSILRAFSSLGCRVFVVPPHVQLKEIIYLKPAGVVLSNGPGNPQEAGDILPLIQSLLDLHVPLMGICFGCQLLGLAAHGKTVKMKLGHHGANHPVIDLANKKTFITSQNHDFVISEEGFPDILEVTHRSLVDGSIEGIRFRNKPAFGFQGHPEGNPGPSDMHFLFHEYMCHVSDYAQRSIA